MVPNLPATGEMAIITNVKALKNRIKKTLHIKSTRKSKYL